MLRYTDNERRQEKKITSMRRRQKKCGIRCEIEELQDFDGKRKFIAS